MEYVYSIFNNVKYYYNSMNPATLSGAIDVIVVEQPDGSLQATPFHVRFGKWAVFNIENNVINIQINKKEIDDVKMKLGNNGVAFFVEEIEDGEELPEHLITNPLPGANSIEIENGGEPPDYLTSPRHSSAESESEDENADNKEATINDHKSTMSANSTASETLLFDEGRIYTSIENGRRIPYKRTFRLKSNQLKDLQLGYGSNKARFSITTKIQGTAWASCHIYLLRWSERIVISDIDGTITKSDVLGHIIPAIGGIWAHTSIVNLYSRIQNNEYRIIYLSSRAIGQSYQTKKYLSSVIQNSKTLPDGPVLLSPTSVLTAFKKEVIERKPEEFKIACLTDLLSLFPTKRPFYAGFGNRETDIKSYVAVGIPSEHIFIIDPSGKVETASHIGFQTNYGMMLQENLVDCFFPPVSATKCPENEFDVEYSNKPLHHVSSLMHWRVHPEAENLDKELETYESKRKIRKPGGWLF